MGRDYLRRDVASRRRREMSGRVSVHTIDDVRRIWTDICALNAPLTENIDDGLIVEMPARSAG